MSLPTGRPKHSRGDGGVLAEKHGGRLGPGGARVAGMMLLEQAGGFHGFEHVGGVAVGAETDADALAQHFEDRRAAHRVAHVGLRIVDDVGLRVAQEIDFVLADVDAMRGERSAAEDAEIGPALDDALAMVAQAVIDVGKGFGGVDVEAGIEIGGGGAAAGESFVAERERCVQAEEAAKAGSSRIAVQCSRKARFSSMPCAAISAPSRSVTS